MIQQKSHDNHEIALKDRMCWIVFGKKIQLSDLDIVLRKMDLIVDELRSTGEPAYIYVDASILEYVSLDARKLGG